MKQIVIGLLLTVVAQNALASYNCSVVNHRAKTPSGYEAVTVNNIELAVGDSKEIYRSGNKVVIIGLEGSLTEARKQNLAISRNVVKLENGRIQYVKLFQSSSGQKDGRVSLNVENLLVVCEPSDY